MGEWPTTVLLRRFDPGDVELEVEQNRDWVTDDFEYETYVPKSRLDALERELDTYRTGKLPIDHDKIKAQEAEARLDSLIKGLEEEVRGLRNQAAELRGLAAARSSTSIAKLDKSDAAILDSHADDLSKLIEEHRNG